MKTGLQLDSRMSDSDLILYLNAVMDMYSSHAEGTAERSHCQELLGAGIDLGVKRPEVIKHFAAAAQNNFTGTDGKKESENIKTLFFLLSETPLPQQTDSPALFSFLFSRQERQRRRWGRGQAELVKKTLKWRK